MPSALSWAWQVLTAIRMEVPGPGAQEVGHTGHSRWAHSTWARTLTPGAKVTLIFSDPGEAR